MQLISPSIRRTTSISLPDAGGGSVSGKLEDADIASSVVVMVVT